METHVTRLIINLYVKRLFIVLVSFYFYTDNF